MSTTKRTTVTAKGQRTRQHILTTALALFADQGYEATTLRSIAAAAGCSLGLTYRYFTRKEDLVLALYDDLARQLEDQIAPLSPLPLAEGFEQVMQAKFALLEPYRDAFGALFAAALTPGSDVAVLGHQSSGTRHRVLNVFETIVRHSSDAPSEENIHPFATVLYATHLALILFWLHDSTEGRAATNAMLSLVCGALSLIGSAQEILPIGEIVTRAAGALEPVFGVSPGVNDSDCTRDTPSASAAS